jgi:hypothetical protein
MAYIPHSRHNPKILWVDDAKIIGDRVAEAIPVLGDFAAQEIERGVREPSACGVAFVGRGVSVDEAPWPLDRVQVRAIGRDEMQRDPAPRPGEPFPHELGVIIARIVENDMDERKAPGKDSLRRKRKIVAWDDDFLATWIAAQVFHLIPPRRDTAIASTAIQTEKALTNGKRAKTGGAIVCGRPPSSTPWTPGGSSAKTRP